MTLTHVQSTYLSCFFESLFLGVHFVLIAVVIWLWTSRKTANKVHYLLYLSLVIMFLVAVAHTTLGVATWILPDTLNKKIGAEQASLLLAIFQFMFGDFVIIWRTWVVWNRNYWIILVPICISISAFGFAFSTVKGGSDFQVVSPSLLVANFMLCTGLIVGRIVYVNMQSKSTDNIFTGIKKSPYKGIIFLLLESGAVYTAVQTTSLILFKKESPILPVFLNLMVPLMGLLPSSIVVLVALDALPSGQDEKSVEDLETVQFQARTGTISGFETDTTNNYTLGDDSGVRKESWRAYKSSSSVAV